MNDDQLGWFEDIEIKIDELLLEIWETKIQTKDKLQQQFINEVKKLKTDFAEKL